MPSVSDKQRRFMRIAAHDPKFARKAHISQKVAEEFYAADKAKEPTKVKIEKRYGKRRKRK
jgi:hypothetical protein